LQHHILSNDGEITESLSESADTGNSTRRMFVIVPYSHPFSDIPSVEHFGFPPEIVTDMWVERCLQHKRFFEPAEHVLGRPIRRFPITGFEKLIINSTGIADMDLLHVSKAVNLLGARYDQVLKPGTSVLLCNPTKAGQEKVRHAREWRIPTVSTEWLWSCIRSGNMQKFLPFVLNHAAEEQIAQDLALDSKAAGSIGRTEPRLVGKREQSVRNGWHGDLARSDQSLIQLESVADKGDSNPTSRGPKAKPIPGEGFLNSPKRRQNGSEVDQKRRSNMKDLPADGKGQEMQEPNDYQREKAGEGLPLQEISTNSPPKAERPPSPEKAHDFRPFDGQSSVLGIDQEDDTPSAPDATSTAKTTYIPPQPESINGAIQELLNKSKGKNRTPPISNGETRKRRLLGRALSNMSNSSREGSNVRASRASSIDSVNTDGLGSVILDEMSQTKRANTASMNGKGDFTGRASAQDRVVKEPSFELGDEALYREEYQEEEEPPQMTQLGYDNPEEAVALREMLAERRRNRTRRGQEDVKPPESKQVKRIKDHVNVITPGRTAGRRTRQTARSP
jgi:DNA replication regulator DPB11